MIKVDLLKNLSFFKNFKENTVIINESDEMGNQMYIVLEGNAIVYRNYGKPDQVTLIELNPGDFFGEMTLFLNKPRTATVVSKTPLKVLEITRNNAYQFFEGDPGATYLLIQALCSRLENLNDSYMALYSRVPQKLIAELAAEKEPKPEVKPEAKPEAKPEVKPAVKPEIKPESKHILKPSEGPVSSLFPSGHKHYNLPEFTAKDGLIRAETMTCPICGLKFSAPQVRTVLLRTLAMDYDMRRRYEGIDVTHYLAVTCPQCLFSAIADKFPDASKNNAAQVIEATALYRNELDLPAEKMDADAIFARLYLAIACMPICYDNSIMFVARLWINVSWLYRDCGDEEMERYAMEQALKSYLKAYTTTTLDKKTDQAICMIAGELSYKLGDENEGKKLLFSAKTNREGAALISNLAEDRLMEIKALETKKPAK